MAPSTNLEASLDKLEANKGPFIAAIEQKTYSKIRSTSRLDCTAIVERIDSESHFTWRMNEGKPYAQRFVKFIRSNDSDRRYNGHDLDSFLSDPIAKIVQNEYAEYINDNVDEVGKAIMSMISNDSLVVNSLRRQIVMNLKNSSTPLSNHAVEKMADALIQSLDISDQAAAQLGHHISGAVG
jgi:hypothetical protein